jgi:integrase
MAIFERGSKTFLLRIYLGRDPITKKRIEINETLHGTFSDAKKRHTQLEAEKVTGGIVQASKMTVNNLLDFYLESFRHIHSESTRNKNIKCLNYYVRNRIGEALVQKIKTSDIQSLFNSLLDQGLKSSSVRAVKKVLHPAFALAVNDKIILVNPVSKTNLPKLNKSCADSLTREETYAFVAVRNSSWYGNAFIFQLYTGLRPQELMALIWQDIDFEKMTVRIERSCKWINEAFTGFGPPKNETSDRTIRISPAMIKLLELQRKKLQEMAIECEKGGAIYGEPKIEEWITEKRQQQAHLYVGANLIFPAFSGAVPHAARPRKELKGMLSRAGLTHRSKIRWHDMRHTHATLLLTDGAPPHEVAKRMGHSVTTLMETYAHVLPERERAAADIIQNLVPISDEEFLPADEDEESLPAAEDDLTNS